MRWTFSLLIAALAIGLGHAEARDISIRTNGETVQLRATDLVLGSSSRLTNLPAGAVVDIINGNARRRHTAGDDGSIPLSELLVLQQEKFTAQLQYQEDGIRITVSLTLPAPAASQSLPLPTPLGDVTLTSSPPGRHDGSPWSAALWDPRANRWLAVPTSTDEWVVTLGDDHRPALNNLRPAGTALRVYWAGGEYAYTLKRPQPAIAPGSWEEQAEFCEGELATLRTNWRILGNYQRQLPYLLCGVVAANGDPLWRLYDPAQQTSAPSGSSTARRERLAAVAESERPLTGSMLALPWVDPNRFIEVRFKNRSGRIVSVYAEGNPSSAAREALIDAAAAAGGASDKPPPQGGGTLIAPRAPGPFTVAARQQVLTNPGSGKAPILTPIRTDRMELVALPTFAGAIRFGLGLVVTPEPRYELQPIGDGRALVSQIAADSVVPELVIGFAPFLERGGRVYHPRRLCIRPAPYFGIGVIAPRPDGTGQVPLDFVTSWYFGTEIELGRYLSIAPTFVLRRGREMRGDLAPGSTIAWDEATGAVNTLPTRPILRPGFALVINLSPAYFRAVGERMGLGGTPAGGS